MNICKTKKDKWKWKPQFFFTLKSLSNRYQLFLTHRHFTVRFTILEVRVKFWKVAMNFAKGPLQDLVTWYGINYTGTQMTQWDFQNKGKSGWTSKSSFFFEVPLRHLRPSVIYSVPCDQILQRAYSITLFSIKLRTSK